MAWEPAWSPDGKRIAFMDDKVRIQVVEIETGKITTADVGGSNIERGYTGLAWSPDSKWLAYARTAPNNFRRITLWSVESGKTQALSNPMADAFAPSWDRNGKYLYFLASTDVALGSGWANTSSIQADPTHGAYIVVLSKDEPTPFPPKSDEEAEKKAAAEGDKKEAADEKPDKADAKSSKKDAAADKKADEKPAAEPVRIDWEGIERRVLALPIPVRSYSMTASGPKGSVFIGERVKNTPGMVLHKFTVEDKKAEEFAKGVQQASVSGNGEKILLQSAGKWRIVGTAKAPSGTDGALSLSLRMELDRLAEWQQMFEEAWRYERDYFYDPNMHGRNWQEVHKRYAPLIPYVRHRSDLTYVLDQMNGELSVGHSFVFGGDFPAVDTSQVGLPGADLEAENGRWRIRRIYTAESWNPGLSAPLDQPGLKVAEGNYLLAVDGVEFSASEDPYRFFDGTAGRQTVLHINDKPSMDGAWKIIVVPVRNDNGLRQRAWVEDNRRKVEALSDGKLAYVWVPNTGGQGFVSFNRYFFAQQDKQGAVIDERFNGGGLLDDYMVDLLTRRLRAAITNEAPGGAPFRLPAGILGPKVLLINELAGSGATSSPGHFDNRRPGR
jgi:tricorn protease